MYVTTRGGTTRGKPIASNCSHDWIPLVSVRRIWSARTPISSPVTALPLTRWASISFWVRLWRIGCCRGPRLRGFSTLCDVHECPAGRSHVLRARTDQAVVVVLLDDVRAPARDAAGRDDRREEVDRDAEGIEERSGIEVDIGNETLGITHAVLQLHGGLIPLELARLAARLLRHTAQDRPARIAGLVHAMAEAHEAPLLGEGRVGEGLDVGDLADFHRRADRRRAR